MNKAIYKHFTCFLCLLFLAEITMSGFGSILCIEDDGRVKIESVCQPGYGDFGEICLLESADSDCDHHGGCNDCTDLPLIQDLLSRRSPGSVITADNHSIYSWEITISTGPDQKLLLIKTGLDNKSSPLLARDILSTTILIC